MKKGLAAVGLMLVTLVATGFSTALACTWGDAPSASPAQGTNESLRDFQKWHEETHRPGGE